MYAKIRISFFIRLNFIYKNIEKIEIFAKIIFFMLNSQLLGIAFETPIIAIDIKAESKCTLLSFND